jgi:hypothetical protein
MPLASYFRHRKQEVEHKKHCSNFVHGNLGMIQSKAFAIGFLFLMPKVRGWEQKSFHDHTLSF